MTASSRRLLCLAFFFVVLPFSGSQPQSKETKSDRLPPGWDTFAQRDEIRPTFSFDPRGGPHGDGAFVITTGDSVGQHGSFRKAFDVTGGTYYRFSAVRQTDHVAVPRRCAIVRIVWKDA